MRKIQFLYASARARDGSNPGLCRLETEKEDLVPLCRFVFVYDLPTVLTPAGGDLVHQEGGAPPRAYLAILVQSLRC